MPSGRLFPSAFGMYRRRTTAGRYVPARNAPAIPSKKESTPLCSIAAIVIESTPAAPLLHFTRFHAARRTSLLQTWSYSTWKRRFGDRLAAIHSRRCSRRTLSTGLRRSGWLGPLVAAIPSRLPASSTSTPQGSFAPIALFCATIATTTIPSDSRCAALAFALGLYEPPCRDCGCADGPLVFRTAPCTRAAPTTPPRTEARSETNAPVVAFAVT